jgi:hypothetical protein
MPINQAEIKRAISLLTTVGADDISGMEPEFFAIYARFSETYKNHIEMQIAKDNANDWAVSQLPPCPKCGGRSTTVCSPVINFNSIYTYPLEKNKTISIGTDCFDNSYFDNAEYAKLAESVRKNSPELAYLLEDHLSCYECDVTYPAKEDLKKLLSDEVPYGTIVEWANKKPAKE